MNLDITEFVDRDENFNYILKEGIKQPPIYLEEILKGQKVNLTFVNKILEECYPYFHNKFIKKEIIDNSIKQGECVHKMVSDSINSRKDFKLNLIANDCKNQNHLNIAKRIITELNSFIYKHDIDFIYSERTFLYTNYDCSYIGTIDLILKSKDTYFIMDIKSSRTNYVDKYNAQLYLYKKLFENAMRKSVKDCYVLNPREERVFMLYEKPTKQEQTRIINKINELNLKN